MIKPGTVIKAYTIREACWGCVHLKARHTPAPWGSRVTAYCELGLKVDLDRRKSPRLWTERCSKREEKNEGEPNEKET